MTSSYLKLQVANNKSTFLSSLCLLEDQHSLLTLACHFESNFCMGFPLLRGNNRELFAWMEDFLRAFASMTLVLSIESMFGLVRSRKKAGIPILPSFTEKKPSLNSISKIYPVLLFSQNCKARCFHPGRVPHHCKSHV